MQNAVIYARYSSHKQKDISIEDQLRICHNYAKENNLNVIEEYTDAAISGRNADKRPSFMRMLSDSKQHLFEFVLVYSEDRFARNEYDAVNCEETLKQNGVELVSVTQPLPDGPERIIIKSLRRGMNEYYSAELAIKSTRGMENNASKGKSNGGAPTMGYKVTPDKHFCIDPDEAMIVRQIYQMYVEQNISIKDILKICDEKHWKSACGKEFKKDSIRRLLSNRKYIGDFSWNEVEYIDESLRIIDNETFEKAAEKLNINRKTGARMKATENYLLGGKVFCGECGEKFVGDSGKSTKQINYYYACKGRKQKKNGCKKKNLPKEPFEEAVMKFIVETFLTDEAIGAISTMAADLANKEAEEKCMLHLYEKELVAAEKKLQKAVDYILTHDDSEVMHDTLVESETRVKELKQVIIKERESYMPVYADDVAGWLRSYRTGNLKDINYCQNLVDMLVNKIVVYDPEPGSEYSKIIIYFNTDPKNHYELTQSDIDDSRSPHQFDIERVVKIKGKFFLVLSFTVRLR